MTAACSICHRRPPRPGLKTCQHCAVVYAAAARQRRARRRGELPPRARPAPPRFIALPTKPRPGAPPAEFRRAAGTRFAVDAAGLRVVRRGPDRQWNRVDLDAAPLVRRALAALVARAWGVES